MTGPPAGLGGPIWDPQYLARTETIRVRFTDPDGLPICEVCLKPVRPDADGVFSQVIGFVEGRSGGGAHAISGRRDLGVYRHKACHRYAAKPDQGTQESLL